MKYGNPHVRHDPPLLISVMPDFAEELSELLKQQGYPYLAEDVGSIPIVWRCRCADDFCATFYTDPQGTAPKNRETFDLEPAKGMVYLDVIGSQIVKVQALYRSDVRRILDDLMPLHR